MSKNMTIIQADEMVQNEHDRCLDTQIKITIPIWEEHRMGTHNVTKNRWHGMEYNWQSNAYLQNIVLNRDMTVTATNR